MNRLITMLCLGYAASAVAVVLMVWHWAYRDGLDQLARTGEIRVNQTAERLVDQLDRYRVLVNVLARDPRIVDALAASEDAGAIGPLLRDYTLAYGAARIELVDRAGTFVATSDPRAGHLSRLGDPVIRAAMRGRLGLTHILEGRARQFRFSRGVFRGTPPPRGVVIVTADIAALEFEWSLVPEAIGFFDDAGIVFAANRPSLLLRQDRDFGADQRFEAFPAHSRSAVGPHEIWAFGDVDELPQTALVISREVPHLRMIARGFLDTGPARAAAWQLALLATAVLAALALIGVIVGLWRRRVADRLAIEAAANARLEARVDARTAELRATQNQLIQASKMTALGQMSAGISHEMNQPLAAIMNFAENGQRFLDIDRPDDARQNLAHISAQVDRITRIMSNLRGFARAEAETIEPVDLAAAVTEAVALSKPVTSKAGVTVHADLPDRVMVAGGRVRLSQVIVNLLSNAVDAMADSTQREIHLSLTEGACSTLTVRDTGPGIAEPERVFEPFYTTKQLGASKGLGLGLSISYGIIGSFGGELSATNHPDGGAVFTIRLPRLLTEVT